MRLPTAPESWVGYTRPKSAQEGAMITTRRYHDSLLRQADSSSNFFQTGTFTASTTEKIGDTIDSRPQTANSAFVSVDGIINPEATKLESILERELKTRRELLRKMLLEETEENQRRLKNEIEYENPTDEMKKKIEILRQKEMEIRKRKEEARREKVTRLMYEQFKKNCPELRSAESEKLQEFVKDTWRDQLDEKSLRQVEEDARKKLEDEQIKEQIAAEEERKKKEKLQHLANQQAIADALELQVQEMREKAEFSKILEKQEEALIEQSQKLKEQEELVSKRKKERENKKYGKLLYRQ